MNIMQLLKNKIFNYKEDKDIFYVAGSQSLPPPLDVNEEK